MHSVKREGVGEETAYDLGSIPLTLVVGHDPIAHLDRTVYGRRPFVPGAPYEGSAGRTASEDDKVEPPSRLLGTFR